VGEGSSKGSIADNTPGTPQKYPLSKTESYNSSTFMSDPRALETHYTSLSDRELLKLRSEGGFTADAEHLLDKELARRKLTPDDAKRHFAPEWLDKADVGTLGVLTLANGERISVEVVGLNEEGDRLSVQVIPSEGFTRKGLPTRRSHRNIPFHRIASFEPRPDLMDKWPFSDPCRDLSISHPRTDILTIIFLFMTLGSTLLFVQLRNRPYGLQEASIITYTLFEVFFTFAHTGGGATGGDVPPFKFTCPAVEPQIPRLLWRHLGFLIALVVLQTALLAARPHLPYWWIIKDRKGRTPFDMAFLLLCLGLAFTQVRTNRSLLDRAHREYSELGTE
jgi:hypothetical protein